MEQITKSRVLGVDISVKRTTYAIVDIRGNVIAQDHFPTNDYPNVNDYVSVLSEKIIMFTEANGGYDTIRSVGISSPSGNYLTGCIENAPNLPWKGVVPLAAMLRDRLGLSVGLANDAYVTALGEHAFGGAHGMRNFVIISLGHGIGSCIFSNGEPHIGANGFAGEIGHICVKLDGRECGCGRFGCFEAYCAEKGIIATAQELMEQSDEDSLMRSLDELSPKTISQCCEKGDRMAIEVYRRTGLLLGRVMAAYATIADPEAIIFTGGISNAGKWLFDPAYEEFNRKMYPAPEGRIKFLTSALNNRIRDVLGASALAWGIKEYSLFK